MAIKDIGDRDRDRERERERERDIKHDMDNLQKKQKKLVPSTPNNNTNKNNKNNIHMINNTHTHHTISTPSTIKSKRIRISTSTSSTPMKKNSISDAKKFEILKKIFPQFCENNILILNWTMEELLDRLVNEKVGKFEKEFGLF